MTTTPDPNQDDNHNPVEPPTWMLDRITAEAELAGEVKPQKPCPVCGKTPEVIFSPNGNLVFGICECDSPK